MQGKTNSINKEKPGLYCWKDSSGDNYYYTLTEYPKEKDLVIQLTFNGTKNKGLIKENVTGSITKRYVAAVLEDGGVKSYYDGAPANNTYYRYPAGDWMPDYNMSWDGIISK